MTNTPTVIEVNCETGNVIERSFTAEEIAQHEADIAVFAAEQTAREEAKTAANAAKDAAHAKLAALGLTADEIAALSK